VNNSCGFPGILRGALMVRARKITDKMAIRAAHSLADFAADRGIDPENIIPTMDEADVFAREAADVAMQAIEDGVAKLSPNYDEVYAQASQEIKATRELCRKMMEDAFIREPPRDLIDSALAETEAGFK